MQSSIEERFNQAVELHRRGSFEEAEAAYRAVIALAPEHAQAAANLGVVLMRLNRYDEAVSAYESALKLAPGLSQVLLNLGIAHYRMGHFEESADVLRRFLVSAPDNLQAQQLLGLSLVALERNAEAIGILEPALERSPEDPAILYGLGQAYMNQREIARLGTLLNRLESIPDGRGPARLLRGQSLLDDADSEKAVAELEGALTLRPDLPRVRYWLGIARMKAGRNREAIAVLEEERKLSPGDSSTLFYLAYAYVRDGDFQSAVRILSLGEDLDPQSIQIRNLRERVDARRAETLFEQGNSYAGARACAACHPAQAGRQMVSNMARALFVSREHPLFERFVNRTGSLAGFRYSAATDGDRFHFSVLPEGPSGSAKEAVRIPAQWAFGAGVHGVTFFSRLETGKYLEHRLSYYTRTGSFDLTPGQKATRHDDAMSAAGQPNDRLEAFRCLFCHTTGTTNPPDAPDIRVGESGVLCEACHGPGRLHMQAAGAGRLDEARLKILNPARAGAARVLEACGRCHREPPLDPAAVNWLDPANARFQPMGLSRSACYRRSEGALSCMTCHDPHGDARRDDSAFYAQRCAGCHQPTKLPPARICVSESAPNCVGCHMPKVESMPHSDFANHWIGIYRGANKLVPVERNASGGGR